MIDVIRFASRNKDNKNVTNFHQRSESIIVNFDWDLAKIKAAFEQFVADGVPGETSRLYVSVNHRKDATANRLLLHYLLDNPDLPANKLQSKYIGMLMRKESAATSKWLFDFDMEGLPDGYTIESFINLLQTNGFAEDEIHYRPSMNGYHVIVDHGFDSRNVLETFPNVTLKRDDLTLFDWATNPS